MKVILDTKRLIIREFEDNDINALMLVIYNPDGSKCEESYAHRWINWCKDSYKKYNFGHWAVILKDTNELIGSIGVSMQTIDGELKPELGYHVRSDYHHQGIAKEANHALINYFFNNYKYAELYSYMNKDNIASIRTAEINGMNYLHLYTTHDGEACKVYRVTREEWLKSK